MALTRANVESILVKRCGKLLTAADLDGSTVDGTNADLNDPIGWAVRQCGGSVSSITAVADADLATVDADDYDQVLDLAELRTLETVQGNLDDVDITLGPRQESLSQLAKQVEQRLARLQKRVEQEYGYGASALGTGVITYEFAEHYDGTDDDE
jgi:hypothetical protein